jgi:hypothetical protein
MMKDFTDITVILDRSGSMLSISEPTVSGFDEFVKSQQAKGDNAALSLVQFDDVYEQVWNSLPINTVPSIKEIFNPRGMTALRDAIGRSINETGKRLAALPESQRPNKVVFVIITDGYENASKEFSNAQITSLIKQQTEQYSWTFIFLGANQDAIASAQDLGIKAGWAATYNANAGSVNKSFLRMSDHVSTYRACTSALEAVQFAGNDKLWTDADREELVEDK